MASFFSGLELDLYDFSGKFVSIVEHTSADASFCINCFLWQALRVPQTGVCLVSLYHSLQHYYHVGMRLGFNVSSTLGKRLIVLDVLYLLGSKCSGNEDEFILQELSKNGLNKIFNSLKSHCEKLKNDNKYVYLIIDDVSQFLNLGVSLNDIIAFVHNVRKLINERITVVVGSHCSEIDNDQLLLKNFILYNSHLRLNIAHLKTGFSKEISGCIEITKKNENQVTGWSRPKLYHYKTGGRTVKVFIPGNIDIVY